MPRSTTDSPPNILLFHCHDLGQHLSCYGVPIETPNLDAFAQDGMIFTNYFCTAAQCSPSRGSIFTGRYPHNNGLVGLAHIGWELNDDEVTLAQHMNQAGYDTCLIGIQHETSDWRRLGYQEADVETGAALQVAPKVTQFLQEQAQQSAGFPFFLSAGTGEPHRPYQRDEVPRDDPAEVTPLPYLPDRPGIREDIAGLNALVRVVDQAFGEVFAALKESGLEQNTLVIFTTDHGPAMPRAKGTCYDPGVKTALIMRWPGHLKGGQKYAELLSNVDLPPTLLELICYPIPDNLDGYSFLPLLMGGSYTPRDHVFLEMTWHDKYNPMRAIRTNRFKYIRNFGDRPLVYLPSDTWAGLAGQEMREEYYSSRRPAEELYDLQADPLEQQNIVDNPDYADVLADLRNRVTAWMEATGDRLLPGDWPPTPEQAKRLERDRENGLLNG